MFRLNKVILTILTIIVVTAISACNLAQAAPPTMTPVDVTAIYVTAMAMANQQMTLNAPTATLTFTPTTPVSETPADAASNTPGLVQVEETSTPGDETSLLTSTVTATPPFGSTDIPTFTPFPSLTPVQGGGSGGSSGGPVCKNAQFNGDLTTYPTDVVDGQVLAPWEKFTKAWAVLNTGTCTWDEGFSFRGWIGPGSMTDNWIHIREKADFIAAGQNLIARVHMYAPGVAGSYVAHWAMYDDQGKQFGGDFTASITVGQ